MVLLWIAIAAYASTNMDNLLVLLVFFSDRSFNAREIVIGEYLGILALVAVSAAAAFTASFVPAGWIGLMGLLPLSIGISKLMSMHRDPGVDETKQYQVEKTSFLNLTHSRILAVALVTISNGGDNIGVYVPLFASSGHFQTIILIIVFLILTGLWCAAAYYMANHPIIGSRVQRFSRVVLPFVWVGLGIFILSKSLPLFQQGIHFASLHR